MLLKRVVSCAASRLEGRAWKLHLRSAKFVSMRFVVVRSCFLGGFFGRHVRGCYATGMVTSRWNARAKGQCRGE